MIDYTRFKKTLSDYEITLADEQIALLDRYAEILVDYNEKVNLTAITDPQGIEEKHFLDSLLFAKCQYVSGSIADVGSGAGFPGVVAKIYNPGLELNTVDPLGKRCTFLTYLLGELGLGGNVIKERAEERARKIYREKYDVATARAVASLRVLCEYCLPLVKVGGHFIAMKGDDTETASAQNAAEKLGGKYVETQYFTLPDGSKRCLIIYKKVAPTPPAYPRNGDKINKKPL